MICLTLDMRVCCTYPCIFRDTVSANIRIGCSFVGNTKGSKGHTAVKFLNKSLEQWKLIPVVQTWKCFTCVNLLKNWNKNSPATNLLRWLFLYGVSLVSPESLEGQPSPTLLCLCSYLSQQKTSQPHKLWEILPEMKVQTVSVGEPLKLLRRTHAPLIALT